MEEKAPCSVNLFKISQVMSLDCIQRSFSSTKEFQRSSWGGAEMEESGNDALFATPL